MATRQTAHQAWQSRMREKYPDWKAADDRFAEHLSQWHSACRRAAELFPTKFATGWDVLGMFAGMSQRRVVWELQEKAPCYLTWIMDVTAEYYAYLEGCDSTRKAVR